MVMDLMGGFKVYVDIHSRLAVVGRFGEMEQFCADDSMRESCDGKEGARVVRRWWKIYMKIGWIYEIRHGKKGWREGKAQDTFFPGTMNQGY
ncbi:predicted protein [Sclerotinia sclerotiorum 1980 UF-70]|uniref:Uncharacterized protein n=1 Tax=Sclerotinia sclerotiorum (strain ATCC 18683 / 1980 / Ss-1) TaxID=665079 RepID=A7EP56_SCLS1|nr:predicted protein [Sclerotinia sclerotiorum 1980 UF-70]EDO04622.1 predicted protein [Sclerotinia sclerotiorum 1980 UF-70]